MNLTVHFMEAYTCELHNLYFYEMGRCFEEWLQIILPNLMKMWARLFILGTEHTGIED